MLLRALACPGKIIVVVDGDGEVAVHEAVEATHASTLRSLHTHPAPSGPLGVGMWK